MDANQILETLSQQQGWLNFLGNDGRMHLADARLSVFRSSQHWAVFTEFPQYAYPMEEFETWLGQSGNCLSPSLSPELDMKLENPIIDPVPDGPLWGEANEYRWDVKRRQFCFLLGGQRLDFSPTEEEYAQAQIFFTDSERVADSLNPGQMLRFLCHHLEHPFFLPERLLRTLIDPVAEAEMELILQTSHWQHPVFLVDYPGAEEDCPDDVIRNIPCWQVLSRVIASGDISEWYAQDTTGFNTDWLSLERIRYENDGELYDNTVYDV